MAMASSEACDFTLEVPEIDNDLLTELLEETCGEHAEAETDCGTSRYVDPCDDGSEHECCGSLDGVLSDLGSEQCCPGSPVSDMSMSDLQFDWPEMDNGMVNGWCMDGGEMSIEYGDRRDVYYGESCVEQVYIPLWQ